MVKFIANFVVSAPRLILLTATALTMAALYFAMTGLSLKVVLEDMLPAEHPNVLLYEQFADRFGGVNTIIVKVENERGDVFDAEFLTKYREISDAFFFHEGNRRPLFEAVNLRKTRAVAGAQGEIVISPLMWPDTPETEEEMERFRFLIKSQFSGYLLSADEKSLLLAAEFNNELNTREVLRFVEDLRAEYAQEDVKISVAGRPILLGVVKNELPMMILVFAASVLAIAGVLYFYFHTRVGVLVPLVVASFVTIWGFGVIGFVQYNLDPLLLLLPFFVFATILSHSVQFVSRVFDALEETGEMKAAVKIGLERLLFPSTAAVITDAAGFTVLALVTIPSIQSLALICTFWLLSLTPGIIIAAALMAIMKPPKRFKTHLPGQKFLYAALGPTMSRLVFLPAFIAAIVIGFFVSEHLKIGDAVGSPILWQDSQYNLDVDDINRSFARVGTDVFQAYFEGEGEIMLDPRVYHQTEAFDRHIYESVLAATRAQSLAPVIKNINMVLWEGDPSYQFIPETEEEVGFNIYMFRSGGEPGDFAAFTNSEWNIGKVSIFTSEHSAGTVDSLMKQGQEFLEQYDFAEGEPKIQFAGGQLGLVKATNDEIRVKDDQLLIAIILVILVNLFWLYRSVSLAAIVVFILATSHFITMGVMTVMDVGMNLNTLPLAALGLGRGVDYSIYMADRIRDEMRAGLSFKDAEKISFNTSGIAVIVTALTMILPLLPWYFLSPIRFQAEMGVLLAIILGFNMIGAVTVVPTLVRILKPRGFGFQKGRGPSEPPSKGNNAEKMRYLPL